MITGLPHIKPRSLRHSYAALAVHARFNAKVLQKAMGHSSIRLMMDTYDGLFDDDLNALAESMDSAASQSLFCKHGLLMVPLTPAAFS